MSNLALSSTSHVVITNPPSLALRRLPGIILPAVVVAATLDAIFAVVAYVFVLDRYSFVGALQYIASGLLGKAAFDGGTATAAFGVVIHMSLAFGFAALYCIVARAVPWVRRGSGVALGLVYGAAIATLMYFLVVPLSAAPKSHDPALFIVAFLADHALCVGLPIAFLINARLRRDLE